MKNINKEELSLTLTEAVKAAQVHREVVSEDLLTWAVMGKVLGELGPELHEHMLALVVANQPNPEDIAALVLKVRAVFEAC